MCVILPFMKKNPFHSSEWVRSQTLLCSVSCHRRDNGGWQAGPKGWFVCDGRAVNVSADYTTTNRVIGDYFESLWCDERGCGFCFLEG
ncbi:hypothetical protein JTE90_011870 [Oedothorax gibbosus]|uniref:Uncharacterized protein n=1 Tax=Oedothorax gibbosus TaxID=931172 RepID=A0AAV6V6A0_9ARAC|nr:hypothetical protein JTE90_011870 [Oedothorax gibbosus]